MASTPEQLAKMKELQAVRAGFYVIIGIKVVDESAVWIDGSSTEGVRIVGSKGNAVFFRITPTGVVGYEPPGPTNTSGCMIEIEFE